MERIGRKETPRTERGGVQSNDMPHVAYEGRIFKEDFRFD